MNASRSAQPRTSPVAFRVRRVTYCRRHLSLLSAGQDEVLGLPTPVELDERPEELALLVRASGVDAERLADAGVAAGLVDVPVEREDGLVAFDRLADCLRAARHRRVARVLQGHVLRELGGVVE